MSTIAEFAECVTAAFAKEITDEIFLSIENDRELMREYLRLVEQYGRQTVNQQIGKKVRDRFSLEKENSREKSPRSVLIESHQEFE